MAKAVKAQKDIEAIKENASTFGGMFPGTKPKASPAAKRQASGRPTSIWLADDLKRHLKAMSRATGKSVSLIVSEAVQAHLSKVKLSQEEQAVYDAVIKIIE